MKKIITFIVLILIAGFFFWNYNTKPNHINLASVSQEDENPDNISPLTNRQDVEVEYEFLNFDFKFTGYGPAGRSHSGIIDSEIVKENQIVFKMNSVKTDEGQNDRLDNHLCQDDFFNCEQYPESAFTLNKIEFIDQNNSRISGTFRLKNVTKNISFVAESKSGSKVLSSTNSTAQYTGSFLLDTTDFDFKVPIVEPEVLIEFDFSVRQTVTENDPEETEIEPDETDEINEPEDSNELDESEL